MSSVKLYYFPGRGRAEATRLALAYQGKAFEDVRLAPAELFGKFKSVSPYGQFPLLEVDGKVLGQSAAQLRWATSALRPADAFEACVVDSIVDQCADTAAAIYTVVYYTQGDEAKAKAKEVLMTEKFPKLLGGIVAYLGDKKLFGGDKPNAADFAVYAIIEAAGQYGFDMSAYATLMEHQKVVRAFPELAAYFTKRDEVEAAEKAASS